MQIGLKVWSINPVAHRDTAIELYGQGLCDYVEIYTVPGHSDRIAVWKECPQKKVIHAPHLSHNFNLADRNLRSSNQKIFREVQLYADKLHADIIICHAGTGGTPDEAVEQMLDLHDERIVVENKPYWQHADLLPPGSDLTCRGAVYEEFAHIAAAFGNRVCHDVTHTVCMANTLKLDWRQEIKRFEGFKPLIYHLSDLETADDELDSHTALGQGKLDWQTALSLIDQDGMLTLETPKISQEHLDDFANEVRMIKSRKIY